MRLLAEGTKARARRLEGWSAGGVKGWGTAEG